MVILESQDILSKLLPRESPKYIKMIIPTEIEIFKLLFFVIHEIRVDRPPKKARTQNVYSPKDNKIFSLYSCLINHLNPRNSKMVNKTLNKIIKTSIKLAFSKNTLLRLTGFTRRNSIVFCSNSFEKTDPARLAANTAERM